MLDLYMVIEMYTNAQALHQIEPCRHSFMHDRQARVPATHDKPCTWRASTISQAKTASAPAYLESPKSARLPKGIKRYRYGSSLCQADRLSQPFSRVTSITHISRQSLLCTLWLIPSKDSGNSKVNGATRLHDNDIEGNVDVNCRRYGRN